MSDYRFEELVPHTGIMALLEQVVSWNGEEIVTSVVIDQSAPFCNGEGVPAWFGLEYMAQTIAAYAGIKAKELDQAVKIGFLLGTRRYECSKNSFRVGELIRVSAREEVQGSNGLSAFNCCIFDGEDKLVAQANLNVFQPEDPEGFLSGEV